MTDSLKAITSSFNLKIKQRQLMGDIKFVQQIALLVEVYNKLVTALFIKDMNKGLIDLLSYCEALGMFTLIMHEEFP